MIRILVVDDDSALRTALASSLEATGRFTVDQAFDGVNALEKFQAQVANVVILDVDMPRLTGLETLKQLKEKDPSTIVIIMTAYANIDDAVLAVKNGAFHYLPKPVETPALIEMIDRALNAYNLVSAAAISAPVLLQSGREMIGHTQQMKKVFNVIYRLSKVDTPVLIRGASGTGKELVARAIHSNSAYKDGKFVAINCSAIPENLFESELFGHEKGSFTGADQRKIGKFQYAEGGTLFLDELGDLPVMMQVKLLRVLQEKMFTPVGANREIESNVRIIAATNRPLEEMIKKSEFREDLYYRLNVMPIFLPSLKERIGDLDHLVNLFIQKFNKAQGKKIVSTTPEAMMVLKKYDWPGNIRELENIIEHAFILEETNRLQVSALPESILMATGTELQQLDTSSMVPVGAAGQSEFSGNGAGGMSSTNGSSGTANGQFDDQSDSDADDGQEHLVSISGIEGGGSALDFEKHKEAFEKEFIIKALKTFKGRINQTALHANIPKKTLLRKMEKYGIIAKDYLE